MRESEVEKQFVNAVRAAGGQALKFTSQTMNGVPDRLVLLLGGKCLCGTESSRQADAYPSEKAQATA